MEDSQRREAWVCPRCNEHLTPDELSSILHLKDCTSRIRLDIYQRTQAKGNNFNAEALQTYLKAKREINSAISNVRRPEDRFRTAAITILRMFRANELISNRNFVSQLDALRPETVDNNGRGTNDEKTTYDCENSYGIGITNIIGQALDGDVKNSPIEVILFVEWKFRPHQSYVDEKDSDLSNISAAEFPSEDLERLRSYVKNEKSLSEIAAELNQGKDQPTYPLAYSFTILDLQIQKLSGLREGWDEPEVCNLLKLLGKGLPIVEVARRLNAANLSRQPPHTPRTFDDVRRKVNELLEWPKPKVV